MADQDRGGLGDDTATKSSATHCVPCFNKKCAMFGWKTLIEDNRIKKSNTGREKLSRWLD